MRRPSERLAVSGWRAFLTVSVALAGLFSDLLLCPFRWLYDIPCPACGLSRATVRLFAGDPGGAFAFHPLVVPALLVIFGWVLALCLRPGQLDQRFERGARLAALAFAFLFVLVWAARFFGAFGGPVPA